MPNIEILRVTWWFLLGVLLIGFAIFDGFDLGIAAIYKFVARTDKEKRLILNTLGPVWEGNQVWFILGGGAIFAAWPLLYAISFSSLYLAMFIVLLAFILRPVSFKYRSKVETNRWRSTWDILFSLSGFIPALLFGVAIGNVMQGLPFNLDNELHSKYTGTFLQLLNPFALLCGLLSLTMFIMQGTQFLSLKTEGDILKRSDNISRISAILVILLFSIGGFFVKTYIDGYIITTSVDHMGPSNPLFKEVTTVPGAWMHNFLLYPLLWIAPISGFLGALLIFILSGTNLYKTRFLLSSISLFGIISTFGLAMFPFLLPSSTQYNSSLTVWDASSSQSTLFTMLIATVIFMPIILSYTSWVYYILRGKVTEDDLNKENNVNSY